MELHAVTCGTMPVEELAEVIPHVAQYTDYIHIREKNKPSQEVAILIEQMLANGVNKEKLVINDRLDLALLFGIPNVHLPGSGLPVKKIKQRFPQIRAGVSVHSLAEAKKAEKDGADYCFFGHIFATDSKKRLAPRGTAALGEITRHVNIPVIAIGGITPDNMHLVLEKGVAGIAVMSRIFSAADPKQASWRFRKELENYIKGE